MSSKPSPKVEQSFTVYGNQLEWLQKMTAKHKLPDESKALRCLLEFAIEEGDEEKLFKTIRCGHCG